MVKKSNSELRFCCDFRPLNAVTVKYAFPLPRIDESLSRLGKVKTYTIIELACAFCAIAVRKTDRQKTAVHVNLVYLIGAEFLLAYTTLRPPSRRALQKIVDRGSSVVMAYIDNIVIATGTIEDHMERFR